MAKPKHPLHGVRRRLDPLIGSTIDGKYRVMTVLGRGGMGVVYEAEERPSGRAVAVKVLTHRKTEDREKMVRFQREARLIGLLEHPNICQVYSAGILPSGDPYLVMERLLGGTLREQLEFLAGVELRDAQMVIGQVLKGLEGAHQAGVVHRDIKPENLFLCSNAPLEASIKIVDFGLSKAMRPFHEQLSEVAVTGTGMVVGTLSYMSPEQVSGKRDLEATSDVWSTAVILYELLTTRRPFEGKGMLDVVKRIKSQPIQPVRRYRPDLPAAIDSLFATALSRNPAQRFATAEQFRVALDRVVEAAGEEDEVPDSAPTQLWRRSSTRQRVAEPSQHDTLITGAPDFEDSGEVVLPKRKA